MRFTLLLVLHRAVTGKKNCRRYQRRREIFIIHHILYLDASIKAETFRERLPEGPALAFFMLTRFGVFAVMRGIFPLKILLLVLAAVEVIPDLRPGHIGRNLLLALSRLFVSGAFHKMIFW
jgi:hypothetical protein